MRPVGPGDVADRFLAHVLAGETRPAVRLATGLVDHGVPPHEVVRDLLAPTEAEIGVRWHGNGCTVADEHLATAVVSHVLGAVAERITQRPSLGRVGVMAARSDGHVLPGRMLAVMLRSLGWDAWWAGAAGSAADVHLQLGRRHPDAVVLGGTVVGALTGAVRLIDAVHEIGVPVLVGGPAFGADADRATRVGADGWAGDLAAADSVLRTWASRRPDPFAVPTGAIDRSLALVELAPALADAAAHAGTCVEPSTGGLLGGPSRHDLVCIIEHLAAAVLFDEPSILHDALRWLAEHDAARGLHVDAVHRRVAALAEGLAAVDPAAAGLLAPTSIPV